METCPVNTPAKSNTLRLGHKAISPRMRRQNSDRVVMPAPGNRAGACSTNQQAQRQVLPAAETRKVFAVGRNNGRGLHKNADGKETTLDARFTQLIHMRASAKEQSQQGRAAKLAARRGIPAEEPAQAGGIRTAPAPQKKKPAGANSAAAKQSKKQGFRVGIKNSHKPSAKQKKLKKSNQNVG